MEDSSPQTEDLVIIRHFVIADYVVFGGMLLVSTCIGIYYGCQTCRRKPEDTKQKNVPAEFLIANGKLGTVPVALSMLASFLSSITLMGQPAEVYLYGSQLWLFGLSSFVVIPFVGYIMMPFFRSANYVSAYEYFGHRFSRRLQLLASCLFSVQMVLYLALVLYAPALAMQQVTGFNTILVVSVMYLVCIFYTTIGGMKAVVWTDTFQVLVLYTAMFAVLIKGTVDIGGFNVVWTRNTMFNRTDLFKWTWDPTERYSVLSSFVGSGFLHLAFYGANQLQVQRYLTVGSCAQARRMLWINTVGWTIVVLLTVYAGLLIFAKYSNCDPLLTGLVTTPDQLFPMYVMDTLNAYPGFPGLFLAGIFSAGLSTVSTGVNSLAAIWFAEMEGTALKERLIQKHAGITVKLLAFIFGVLSYLLVFVVPYLGGLAKITISLSGVFAGSLFGLFLLGMFMKRANTWGATAGLLTSVLTLTWMTVGSMYAARNGQLVDVPLPSSTEQCQSNTTLAGTTTDSDEAEPAFFVFRISYMWYCLLATSITVIVGASVSCAAERLGLDDSNGYAATQQSEDDANMKLDRLLDRNSNGTIVKTS